MFIVNFWAVLVSTVASAIVGMIWYTPLTFGNARMKAAGRTPEDINKKEANIGYVVSLISHFIAIYFLAVFMKAAGFTGWLEGLFSGIAVAIAFMGTTRATNYMYEGRGTSLFLINTGYNLVVFSIAGVVVGIW